MVVQSRASVDPAKLDLGYLALFVGLAVNERVLEKIVARGGTAMRQSHGYVIQHLVESDRTISELAGRMEVTQQAVSKMVREMSRLGIVEMVASVEDKRSTRVRLSAKGWESVQQARKIRAGIEKRLMKVLGALGHEDVRTALLTALNELGGVERVRSRRVRMSN